MRRNLEQQKPNARRFHEKFKQMDIDPMPFYAALNINPATMISDSSSINMRKYLELLELVANKTGRRFLGMDMALNGQYTDLGILAYILANASNLENGIELLARYVRMVAPSASITLIAQQEECILTYKLLDYPPDLCCQDVEGTMAQFVLMIRSVLQDETWQSHTIFLEHSAQDKTTQLCCPLDSELVFNHAFNGICFQRDILQYPNQQFDSQLLALLENQVMQTANNLLRSDTLLDKTRFLISSSLGNKAISAEKIAAELGMSRRTFYRRLSENNTSFNILRETEVVQLAKESLAGTSITITQLAQKLGYSDSSAFNRAFKRMTQHSPLEYRKLHNKSRK